MSAYAALQKHPGASYTLTLGIGAGLRIGGGNGKVYGEASVEGTASISFTVKSGDEILAALESANDSIQTPLALKLEKVNSPTIDNKNGIELGVAPSVAPYANLAVNFAATARRAANDSARALYNRVYPDRASCQSGCNSYWYNFQTNH